MNKKTNLKIVYQGTDKLIPYLNNARTHGEAQVKQIAASIEEFGFTNPLLLDEENGIIAGHGRLMAAELLQLEKVPTIKLVGLSEEQKKAYVIADNQLALNAGWDFDLLKSELLDLQEFDFDMELLGFSDDDLKSLLGTDEGAGGGAGSVIGEFRGNRKGFRPFIIAHCIF